MKILITGIAGFVGNHLTEYLTGNDTGDTIEIAGVDINLENFRPGNHTGRNVSIMTSEIDLRDRKAVEILIGDFMPDIIYHLAAQSSVGYSWENPIETFETNISGGINILESVKSYCPDCRVLVACTAEEYGEVEKGNDEPITEDFKIHPTNPYAISKSALDFFATTFQKINDLHIYVSRSFNHTGRGQSERFVTSDF